jgi:hypothetical protein
MLCAANSSKSANPILHSQSPHLKILSNALDDLKIKNEFAYLSFDMICHFKG